MVVDAFSGQETEKPDAVSVARDKEARYETLCRQVASLVAEERDAVADMANVAALLYEEFRFWWVGFYRVSGEELVLSPFQGSLACTRIAFGRGVCGTAWREGRTIVVPDVEAFPGHIACSAASRSEIVVPLFRDDRVVAVLDIDSERMNAFDDTDARWLERICQTLGDAIAI